MYVKLNSVRKILKPLNIYPAWTLLNLTFCIFSKLEDFYDNTLQSNVIYGINYINCNATYYVGETSQYVKKWD